MVAISMRTSLRHGAALSALIVSTLAAPAFAQSTATGDEPPSQPTTVPATTATQGDGDQEIVVTGSILRRTNAETPSPVTVLSAESLQLRGINTVAEAVQRLSANGAGTITQGWNTGSNFATGANAVSLRGLTVQSTLTVFDGLRMAPYPLADDGHRNFVDLNTIPNAIIERIEVLRDGASSTYGADAVAGVINVITKKQIQGVHLNGSAGISQRGDAAEQRIDLTLGYGDLEEQGFNFYINGEYQRNEALYARDRGFPYNTADLSSQCAPSIGRPEIRNAAGTITQTAIAAGTVTCRANGIRNGFNADGGFNGLLSTTVPVVRGVDAAGAGTTRYNLLNAAAGCRDLVAVNVPTGASATAGPVQCQQDFRNQYSQLLPDQERLGFAGRFTAKLGDRAEFYAIANYYQTSTRTQISPLGFNNQTTPPGTVLLNPLYLPTYVCANGVGTLDMLNTGCNAANGTLNPNNPFAAAGQRAQILALYDRPRDIQSKARALRGVVGVSGSFGDDWRYAADVTASNVQLDIRQANYLIPQRILDVVARGTYNFVNPELNSQEIRDYIAPVNQTRSTSDLWQAQGTLSKDLFQLPGGPLQTAVGVAYRHESINNPSANPANESNPYDRYYGVNSVGAIGSRNVKSAFYEINAPIVREFEINASGRYDDYSSGQKNFSPKFGAKFTPIPQAAIRGTWSKGFRIPSFNEAFGLPTTGYITRQLDRNNPAQAAFIAAHGGNNYATDQFSVGQTTEGNPALDPEKSTSWTVGAIFEPIRRVSLTVDYFNIKIKGIIGAADDTGVFEQYYANNGVVNVPGITVRPGIADVNFPNALPHIGFIESSFQNGDSQEVSGIDLGVNVNFPFSDNVRLISGFEGTYLINFDRVLETGNRQRYAGTLSPCDVTSCSGSPRWRATWQNTLEMGPATVSVTTYYTSGYDLASIDYDGVKGDCLASIGASVVTYRDGVTPVLCKGPETWNVDLSATYKVSDRFSIYTNVLNVLDLKAPFDPSAAYSQGQFNPAWAGANILGRFIRVGARVDF
ncbi:TonB-dependent receptor domain-containing protein [Sphingomonas hankookensis]